MGRSNLRKIVLNVWGTYSWVFWGRTRSWQLQTFLSCWAGYHNNRWSVELWIKDFNYLTLFLLAFKQKRPINIVSRVGNPLLERETNNVNQMITFSLQRTFLSNLVCSFFSSFKPPYLWLFLGYFLNFIRKEYLLLLPSVWNLCFQAWVSFGYPSSFGIDNKSSKLMW